MDLRFRVLSCSEGALGVKGPLMVLDHDSLLVGPSRTIDFGCPVDKQMDPGSRNFCISSVGLRDHSRMHCIG